MQRPRLVRGVARSPVIHPIGAVGSAKQYRQEVCCNGHLYVQAGALDHVRYGVSYTVHRLQIPETAELFDGR